MIAQTKKFIHETRVELQKATWPWNPKEKGFKRYKELTDSTIVVVIASLLLAGFISISDFLLVQVVGYLTQL